MSWNRPEKRVANLLERSFVLDEAGRAVPGVAWSPATGVANRLVLLGHGGTLHKKAEYIRLLAMGLAGYGIASMAIDGPGHGERPAASGSTAFTPEKFTAAWESDGGTEGIVSDWIAALDYLESEDGARPTGWWGLSMGTMMGIPVIAREPRISAAVLGLMGVWGPNAEDLLRLAPEVHCPVRFLLQLDDEVVPGDAVRTLFAAVGANEKTLRENPGSHTGVPMLESLATLAFLNDHV